MSPLILPHYGMCGVHPLDTPLTPYKPTHRSKHGGINSEDVKYLALTRPAQHTHSNSKHQHQGSRRTPVSFADLFQSRPTAPARAGSGTGAGRGVGMRVAAPSATASQGRGGRSGTLLVSFGTIMRTAASSSRATKVQAGAGGRGTQPTAGRASPPTGGRRRLRREGAVRKKRLTKVKQLVLRERADRGVAAAEDALARANAALADVAAHHARLLRDMQAAAAELQGAEPGGSSSCSKGGGEAGATGVRRSSEEAEPPPTCGGGLLPKGLPPRVALGVLQVSLEGLDAKLRARQEAASRAASQLAAAQALRNKVYKLGEDVGEAEVGGEGQEGQPRGSEGARSSSGDEGGSSSSGGDEGGSSSSGGDGDDEEELCQDDAKHNDETGPCGGRQAAAGDVSTPAAASAGASLPGLVSQPAAAGGLGSGGRKCSPSGTSTPAASDDSDSDDDDGAGVWSRRPALVGHWGLPDRCRHVAMLLPIYHRPYACLMRCHTHLAPNFSSMP